MCCGAVGSSNLAPLCARSRARPDHLIRCRFMASVLLGGALRKVKGTRATAAMAAAKLVEQEVLAAVPGIAQVYTALAVSS